MRFLMTDGILKHISAGDEQVDAEGWATRRAEYCPVNVDCPDFVRRVVGDTMFELSDEQKWNDAVRPYHLTFVIRPSFLTKLSNTRGELQVRPFPPEKQPQLAHPPPQSLPQSTQPASRDPESESAGDQPVKQQAQEPHLAQKGSDSSLDLEEARLSESPQGLDSKCVTEWGTVDQPEAQQPKHDHQNEQERQPVPEREQDAGESTATGTGIGKEPLLGAASSSVVVDAIDDGVVSPCSEYTSFEDLDELLDDSPFLPDKPTPSVTSPMDDVASEIDSSVSTDIGDGSMDSGDADCDDDAHAHDRNDGHATESDSTSGHSSAQEEPRDGENNASPDNAHKSISADEDPCEEPSSEKVTVDAAAFSLDWQDDAASADKELDVTAEIDRLPVEEKCLLEVSGRTCVRIITIGWFVERTIVHNLRQFYGDYPATLLRFRRMLYRRFADGDYSVPISVVVDRLLQWERIHKQRLEDDLDQFCNERSSFASRDRRKNIRCPKEPLDTNSSCPESSRESATTAANPITDSQLETPGPVTVSV